MSVEELLKVMTNEAGVVIMDEYGQALVNRINAKELLKTYKSILYYDVDLMQVVTSKNLKSFESRITYYITIK